MSSSATTLAQGLETRKKILAFIVSYVEDKGFAPSIKEIANGVGLASTYSVRWHLARLESAGTIRRTAKTSRGMILGAPKAIKDYLALELAED